MRSVNATIATTVLAVPASAMAITTTTASDRRVPATPTTVLAVRVSPRDIVLGDPVKVAGRDAGAAGERVVLEADFGRARAWRRLAITAVDRRGRFVFRAHLRHSGLLRAVPASGLTPAPVSSPAGVGTRRGAVGVAGAPADRLAGVRVAAVLRLGAPLREVLAGDSIDVSGRLLPGQAGRTVRLQGHSSAGWRTVARTRTSRRGGFAVRYVPGEGLQRRLRVVFSGDRDNARTVGGAGATTVYHEAVASWYEDGGSTACGFHAGLGVANRSLPCGTRVSFRHDGRSVTAVVDDRGPYVGGRDWDLNQNTAAALGFDGVGTVWTSR